MTEDAKGWIYFLGSLEAGYVKIGFTTQPRRRFAELKTGHWDDLDIIDVAPGLARDEATLHRLFAPLRVKREWFRLDDATFKFWELFEDQRRDRFVFDPETHTTEDDIWITLDETPITPFLNSVTWADICEGCNG